MTYNNSERGRIRHPRVSHPRPSESVIQSCRCRISKRAALNSVYGDSLQLLFYDAAWATKVSRDESALLHALQLRILYSLLRVLRYLYELFDAFVAVLPEERLQGFHPLRG